jgi:xanthosine utilization system XapX-like protein
MSAPRTLVASPARPLVAVAGLFLGLSIGAAGCARVAPYEREVLARRDMEMGGDADLAAGEEHAVAYREGSSGGGDAKGGGCGCN